MAEKYASENEMNERERERERERESEKQTNKKRNEEVRLLPRLPHLPNRFISRCAGLSSVVFFVAGTVTYTHTHIQSVPA